MIARPDLKRLHPLPGTPRLPRAGLAHRIAFRLGTAVSALAARLVSRADEPTRFSSDAWNAWSERGTL